MPTESPRSSILPGKRPVRVDVAGLLEVLVGRPRLVLKGAEQPEPFLTEGRRRVELRRRVEVLLRRRQSAGIEVPVGEVGTEPGRERHQVPTLPDVERDRELGDEGVVRFGGGDASPLAIAAVTPAVAAAAATTAHTPAATFHAPEGRHGDREQARELVVEIETGLELEGGERLPQSLVRAELVDERQGEKAVSDRRVPGLRDGLAREVHGPGGVERRASEERAREEAERAALVGLGESRGDLDGVDMATLAPPSLELDQEEIVRRSAGEGASDPDEVRGLGAVSAAHEEARALDPHDAVPRAGLRRLVEGGERDLEPLPARGAQERGLERRPDRLLGQLSAGLEPLAQVGRDGDGDLELVARLEVRRRALRIAAERVRLLRALVGPVVQEPGPQGVGVGGLVAGLERRIDVLERVGPAVLGDGAAGAFVERGPVALALGAGEDEEGRDFLARLVVGLGAQARKIEPASQRGAESEVGERVVVGDPHDLGQVVGRRLRVSGSKLELREEPEARREDSLVDARPQLGRRSRALGVGDELAELDPVDVARVRRGLELADERRGVRGVPGRQQIVHEEAARLELGGVSELANDLERRLDLSATREAAGPRELDLGPERVRSVREQPLKGRLELALVHADSRVALEVLEPLVGPLDVARLLVDGNAPHEDARGRPDDEQPRGDRQDLRPRSPPDSPQAALGSGADGLARDEPVNVVRQLVGVRVPPLVQFVDRLADDRVDPRGDVGHDRSQRRRVLREDLGGQLGRGLGEERADAGDELVEDDSERVDVGPGVDAALADELLGSHVARRADEVARARDSGVALRGVSSEPEVGDARVAAPRLEHDVRRLDVAVDDSELVGRSDPARDLRHQLGGLVPREAAALLEHLLERASGAVLHDVVVVAIRDSDVVDGDDVGVLDARGESGLAPESLDRLAIRQRAAEEDLDREQALESGSAPEVDDAHGASAELAQDLVGAERARGRGLIALRDGRHQSPAGGRLVDGGASSVGRPRGAGRVGRADSPERVRRPHSRGRGPDSRGRGTDRARRGGSRREDRLAAVLELGRGHRDRRVLDADDRRPPRRDARPRSSPVHLGHVGRGRDRAPRALRAPGQPLAAALAPVPRELRELLHTTSCGRTWGRGSSREPARGAGPPRSRAEENLPVPAGSRAAAVRRARGAPRAPRALCRRQRRRADRVRCTGSPAPCLAR